MFLIVNHCKIKIAFGSSSLLIETAPIGPTLLQNVSISTSDIIFLMLMIKHLLLIWVLKDVIEVWVMKVVIILVAILLQGWGWSLWSESSWVFIIGGGAGSRRWTPVCSITQNDLLVILQLFYLIVVKLAIVVGKSGVDARSRSTVTNKLHIVVVWRARLLIRYVMLSTGLSTRSDSISYYYFLLVVLMLALVHYLTTILAPSNRIVAPSLH